MSWININELRRQDVSSKQLRSFGLLVGAAFSIIAIWPAVFRGAPFRFWALIACGVLIIPALLAPQMLRSIYQVWMLLGHILGWINTRILLGLIFYLVFTPIAVLMRLMKRDPLRLKSEPDAATYRVTRQRRPGSHMRQQF